MRPTLPYSFDAWGLAAGTGAALLWRAPTQLRLPVVKVLCDGTYISVLVNPTLRGARRERVLTAARAGEDLDPADGHLVRVIEYDVPDRVGNATGELIVLLTTILDPADARADELAAAYHQRWEEETANDQLKTHLCGPGKVLKVTPARPGPPRDLGLADRPLRDRRPHQPGRRGRRGRRPRPRPDLLHPHPAHRPPHRHWYGGFPPSALD